MKKLMIMLAVVFLSHPLLAQTEKDKQEMLKSLSNMQTALLRALETVNETILLIDKTPPHKMHLVGDQILANLDKVKNTFQNATNSPEATSKIEASHISDNFYTKNTSLKNGVLGPVLIGELVNNSGRSYSLVNFTVSLYHKNGSLLATTPLNMSNFQNKATKSFSVYLFDIDNIAVISRYKIQFENGF